MPNTYKNQEPSYVEAGDEFGDLHQGARRHKWMTPKHPLAVKMLAAVHRQYYATRAEQAQVNAIAKAAVPLAMVQDLARNRYPTEWVEARCRIAEKMWAERKTINLSGLITLIEKEDYRQKWCTDWLREHQAGLPTPAFDAGLPEGGSIGHFRDDL